MCHAACPSRSGTYPIKVQRAPPFPRRQVSLHLRSNSSSRTNSASPGRTPLPSRAWWAAGRGSVCARSRGSKSPSPRLRLLGDTGPRRARVPVGRPWPNGTREGMGPGSPRRIRNVGRWRATTFRIFHDLIRVASRRALIGALALSSRSADASPAPCASSGAPVVKFDLWWESGPRHGFFPHFAPRPLTCGFAAMNLAGGGFGLVLVEECGVQWGAVERDSYRSSASGGWR
jgi:hypothetical protein